MKIIKRLKSIKKQKYQRPKMKVASSLSIFVVFVPSCCYCCCAIAGATRPTAKCAVIITASQWQAGAAAAAAAAHNSIKKMPHISQALLVKVENSLATHTHSHSHTHGSSVSEKSASLFIMRNVLADYSI